MITCIEELNSDIQEEQHCFVTAPLARAVIRASHFVSDLVQEHFGRGTLWPFVDMVSYK